jgi:hypothetical protein
MIWVAAIDRTPTIVGNYYWKGKSGYGGLVFFDGNNFNFSSDVPKNKIDIHYLFWLEE